MSNMLLPHGVPSRRTPNNHKNSRSKGSFWSVVALTAVPSFLLGSLSAMLLGLTHTCGDTTTTNTHLAEKGRLLDHPTSHENLDVLCRDHATRALDDAAERAAAADGVAEFLPSDAVGRYASAMARISKQDFTDRYDLGVPLDPPGAGAEDVLILYANPKALPSTFPKGKDAGIPELDAAQATEKCEYMNVVLTDHGNRQQCLAIVPQYESYHVQKWMRINPQDEKIDGTQELQMYGRGQSNGRDQFGPPELNRHTRKHWNMLQQYFSSVDDVLAELKPVLERIAVKNTVIVLVCNFGQSELLMNFVCAAKSRGFDLSSVIVFTTDQETTDIAESLGLTAFYDHRNFGDIPAEAAGRYGDAKFVAMMMAKVICVQLVSMLGYDFLFQDVDIVWYKNPLDYFHDPSLPSYKFDAVFQDDGGHSVRYAPYSANSGFYFIRYNKRTRHFLTSLLMAGDLIMKTDSHQQALIATLNEHVSLFGLRVKVIARNTDEFPGGFQFHMKKKDYMKGLFAGTIEPYIFHMSWTHNKVNKLLFFRQMGEWYVNDQCIEKQVDQITQSGELEVIPTCCAAEPLFSCHYRDKPSLHPCKDSDPIDKGKKSWW